MDLERFNSTPRRSDTKKIMDVVVENAVIIEVKAVEPTFPIQQAKHLSYLKLLHQKVGHLFNFHVSG